MMEGLTGYSIMVCTPVFFVVLVYGINEIARALNLAASSAKVKRLKQHVEVAESELVGISERTRRRFKMRADKQASLSQARYAEMPSKMPGLIEKEANKYFFQHKRSESEIGRDLKEEIQKWDQSVLQELSRERGAEIERAIKARDETVQTCKSAIKTELKKPFLGEDVTAISLFFGVLTSIIVLLLYAYCRSRLGCDFDVKALFGFGAGPLCDCLPGYTNELTARRDSRNIDKELLALLKVTLLPSLVESSGLKCEACPKGSYVKVGSHRSGAMPVYRECVKCPIYHTTARSATEGNHCLCDTEADFAHVGHAQCVCKPGYELDVGGGARCTPCPSNKYKASFSNVDRCISCPADMSVSLERRPGTAENECVCNANFYWKPPKEGGAWDLLPSSIGSRLNPGHCVRCPPHFTKPSLGMDTSCIRDSDEQQSSTAVVIADISEGSANGIIQSLYGAASALFVDDAIELEINRMRNRLSQLERMVEYKRRIDELYMELFGRMPTIADYEMYTSDTEYHERRTASRESREFEANQSTCPFRDPSRFWDYVRKSDGFAQLDQAHDCQGLKKAFRTVSKLVHPDAFLRKWPACDKDICGIASFKVAEIAQQRSQRFPKCRRN